MTNRTAQRCFLACGLVVAALVAGCATTQREPEPPSPLKTVDQFYAAPVVFDFDLPADWEIPADEWRQKQDDFTEAFRYRLEVTKRAPISRLEQEPVPSGDAIIELVIYEVDLGFFAGLIRKPAICRGELFFLDANNDILESYEVEFRTPNDAGFQWYTYGGRLESAFDAYGVDIIDIIQRAQRE